jgi:hypothetical protein
VSSASDHKLNRAGGRVLVIGSANIDVILRVKSLPGPGETVLAENALLSAGDKGAEPGGRRRAGWRPGSDGGPGRRRRERGHDQVRAHPPGECRSMSSQSPQGTARDWPSCSSPTMART